MDDEDRQQGIDMDDVFLRFIEHQASADKRGIEFLMTFDEWWSVWEPHWRERGGRGKSLCMCRRMDIGPYAIGNVYIDTRIENSRLGAKTSYGKRIQKEIDERKNVVAPRRKDELNELSISEYYEQVNHLRSVFDRF